MIPKTLHYCWFGPNKKDMQIESCIASWKKHCPDFAIKEWNESTFNVEDFPFTKKMYQEKKWAFVADYVRIVALLEEGGFYLDTDMLLLQSLEKFTDTTCVLGEESVGIISAGMIGIEAHHPYMQSCKKHYDSLQKLETIPRILTNIYKELENKNGILVLPPKAFYPFSQETIKKYHGQDLGEEVYGVHLWNYSWGHPLNKFFKKIGIYSFGKKIVELLGIKTFLKKLLGFI